METEIGKSTEQIIRTEENIRIREIRSVQRHMLNKI